MTDRISKYVPVEVDCSNISLRNLMTAQCRSKSGFVTVYSGTTAQFLDAGLPESALPGSRSKRSRFKLVPGSRSSAKVVDATIERIDGYLELEINWGGYSPGSCGHPALTEAARLMICALGTTTRTGEWDSLEFPVERLLEFGQDYRMDPSLRWKTTRDFRHRLSHLHRQILDTIRAGEIFPTDVRPVAPSAQGQASELEAQRMARALISSAQAQAAK